MAESFAGSDSMIIAWLTSRSDLVLMVLKQMNVGGVVLPGLAEHECSPILPIYPRARAKKNPPGSGGLIDRVTGLRVLMIIVEIT